MEKMTRREALSLGRRRFYTGKPCKYDHDSERYTTSGACVACTNPKLDVAALPPPLEKVELRPGYWVTKLSQEEAYAKGWRVFFTGQPCNEGHLAERSVRDGRCLECMHPPRYGVHAETGWWAFQPKPPLRVPPNTPLSFHKRLAEKLQGEIPRLVKEIEVEQKVTIPAPHETSVIYGLLHIHTGQRWEGLKVWWPRMERISDRFDKRIVSPTVPWVERDSIWYGIMSNSELIPVLSPETQYEKYDPQEGRRKSQAESRTAARIYRKLNPQEKEDNEDVT